MQFTQISDKVIIGNNNYTYDLDTKWNAKNIGSTTIGMGYTHIAKSGFSFNIGIWFPLSFPDDKNVSITPINPAINILASDLSLARQQIQYETFYGPIMINLNLGYIFKKFW
jgi:hypothetical protein